MKLNKIRLFLYVFQIAMRTVFPLLARSQIRSAIDYLSDVYKRNECTDENRSIFTRFTSMLRGFEKSRLIGSVIMSAAFAISPVLVYYLSDSQLTVLLPMYWPGTSPTTTHIGYIVNLTYQMFAFYIGVLTYTYYDMLFIFQLFHVILLTNILSRKIRTVSKMASMKRPNAHVIDINFRNVILIHVELIR